jgi:hydrogenase-1 operon protein HyaE
MMDDYSKPTLTRLDERLARIAAPHSYSRLDAAGFDALLERPGASLVLFAEDPLRVPETWDLAVILADILKSVAQPLRIGLLPPEAALPLSKRYGISLWPTLVGLRDGGYVGSIEGMMDWHVFRRRLEALLEASVRRLPGIGIPVQAVQAPQACH